MLPEFPAFLDNLAVNVQRGACAFLPAELRGAMQTKAFHPSTELRIEQDIRHASFDIVDGLGVE